MHQMVLLVLDDVNHCSPVLDAWEAAGVSGITILDSTGLGRVRAANRFRDDFPLMPSIANLMKSREERHRTIFTVVDSDEMVDKLVRVTQEITGGLDAPNQGVIFVLPVSRAIGLRPGDWQTS
jgi:nitrogen regulatory protein PII